jgi:hypothetical protein
MIFCHLTMLSQTLQAEIWLMSSYIVRFVTSFVFLLTSLTFTKLKYAYAISMLPICLYFAPVNFWIAEPIVRNLMRNHNTWAILNDVLHKYLSPISVSVHLWSSLGNGSVKTLPRYKYALNNRIIFLVETPFYLQSVYIHSANWCEEWV